MRYRKGILILALAVFLLSIAGAWAGNTNDTATGDNSPLELSEDDMISIDENEDMLSENEKTFGDLNTTINGNGDSDIYLDCDYRYTENDSAFNEGIVINRDLNVYGNGHVINGSNEARIFNIISGKVMFHNITFTNGNIGKWTDGGALYGECTAVNCTFIRNAAYHGGAMAGGSAVNCTFTKNTASKGGGAMWQCSATNCIFTENTGMTGGAIFDSSAVDCIFNNNTGMTGGAILEGSALNCIFNGNTASQFGGAMSGGCAVNCIFNYNTVSGTGGAIYEGIAISCKFNGNTALFGKSIYMDYYIDCIGQEDTNFGDELILEFNMDDLITTYNPNNSLHITLINQEYKALPFIDVKVIIYEEDNEIMRGNSFSGDNLYFNLAAGNYTAKLSVTNDKLNVNSTSINLTINKATPKIEVTSREATYPENITITIKTDISGNYTLTVANITQNITLEANSAKNITITGLAANETGYIINITHNSENYTGFNDTTKAVVHKATPKIEVNTSEATYPENITITIKTDISGNYTLTVANITQNITLEANSAKNITITGLAANETGYIINITHNSENYTGFNDTTKAVVHKATPKIEVTAREATYSENITITIKTDISGEYIVKVGNITQNITLEANSAKNITITGLAANETGYLINITHNSENYTGFNDTEIVKVKKEATKITAEDITATYNINKDIVIRLTDSKGQPLTGEMITVDLNGAKIYITDANGQVKVTTQGLTPKTYTVTITFGGNANYTQSQASAKVTVKKAKPKLTAKKKTFKKSKKVKKYSVTLKTNTNKALKKVKLTLKIKGKTYKAKTNAKGKATFKIKKLTKKGTYKAKVTFKGNKYYNKVTKKVKIKIK